MSVFPGPSNAIVYAQFVLQGRWRRMLLVAGIYGLLVSALMWISAIAIGTPHPSPQDMMGYVAIIAALQVGNLLIFGSFRVEQAVRGDVTSRMIESHRLMPASPLGSIFGYLFGSPLQSNLLAVVNFALGAGCCIIGGLPLAPWVMVNAALYFFAIFVHALLMQLAFVSRGGFLLLLFFGFLLISAGASGGLEMVPSFSVLFFPILSKWSVFGQMFNSAPMVLSSTIAYGYGCGFLGQAIIAAVASRVAMRRYLSSSLVGISPPLALILLATWVALAVAHFGLAGRFSYRGAFSYSYHDERFVPQTVCSFASTMLLAMLPIASAARSAHAGQRGGELSGRYSKTRFSELWTLISVIAIIAVLLISVSVAHFGSTIKVSAITALICANFCISMACLFSRGYRKRGWPWIIVSIWVVITWIGPILIDAIYRNMTNDDDIATLLTALSPPGALALLWSDSTVALRWGIIGQDLLTLVALGLLLLARRKASARRTGEGVWAPAAI